MLCGRQELFSGTGRTVQPRCLHDQGMLVTVLGRLWDVDTSGLAAAHSAMWDADAYYASYVQWAAEKEIVSGTGNNRFAPDRPSPVRRWR